MIPPRWQILQQKDLLIFFSKLYLPDGFLEIGSSEWETNVQYQKAKAVVGSFAVANEHVECGIALVQEYSGHLTKDEDKFQYLL